MGHLEDARASLLAAPLHHTPPRQSTCALAFTPCRSQAVHQGNSESPDPFESAFSPRGATSFLIPTRRSQSGPPASNPIFGSAILSALVGRATSVVAAAGPASPSAQPAGPNSHLNATSPGSTVNFMRTSVDISVHRPSYAGSGNPLSLPQRPSSLAPAPGAPAVPQNGWPVPRQPWKGPVQEQVAEGDEAAALEAASREPSQRRKQLTFVLPAAEANATPQSSQRCALLGSALRAALRNPACSAHLLAACGRCMRSQGNLAASRGISLSLEDSEAPKAAHSLLTESWVVCLPPVDPDKAEEGKHLAYRCVALGRLALDGPLTLVGWRRLAARRADDLACSPLTAGA